MLVDEDQLALDGVEVAPEAAEARPGGWGGRPAAGHGFVDRLGRVLGTLQRAALLDKLHHLHQHSTAECGDRGILIYTFCNLNVSKYRAFES